jgi:DUF438 domain-containing protein
MRPQVLPPGHPVDTFTRENTALRETCARLRALGALLVTGDGGDQPVGRAQREAYRRVYNDLMDVEKHYLRKEHLLFPFLERSGITGPSKVMWGKDDEVRELLEQLGIALAEEDVSVAEWRLLHHTVTLPALAAVEEMILKEERILFPLAIDTLTAADWSDVWAQSPQIGWCLVEPRTGWSPPPRDTSVSQAASAAADRTGVVFDAEGSHADPAGSGPLTSGALVFPTGAITLDQLKAIFNVLPVDLTFVDADDRVRFFTEGPARVFHRAKAVVGRKVQHCHPPGSVGVVERILSDFRDGRQNVAAFWISLRGRFVYIRYFAVRDEAGAYLGTLEVTQDLTRERALESERRLLEYD